MSKWLGIVTVFIVAATLSSTPGSAKVGAVCGGFAGLACGPHEFCEHPPGTCPIIDMLGTCVAVPRFCMLAKKQPAMILPVCGCDGRTYGNDCERERARVSKAHDGKCWETR